MKNFLFTEHLPAGRQATENGDSTADLHITITRPDNTIDTLSYHARYWEWNDVRDTSSYHDKFYTSPRWLKRKYLDENGITVGTLLRCIYLKIVHGTCAPYSYWPSLQKLDTSKIN